MKDKFESILLQLKSNLKSPSVINELKTEYDKELHDKLINAVNNYYENIELFDKQKDSLQKLLFENANNLLQNTNSGYFSLYLSNYRNYANFLVDNYYKNENNITNISTLSENKKDAIKDILSESISMQTSKERAKKKLIEDIEKNSGYNPDYLSLQAKTVEDMMKNSKYNPDFLSSQTKTISELMKNPEYNPDFLSSQAKTEKTIKKDNGFTVGDGTLIGEKIIKEKEEIEIHKNNIALISSDNPSNENDDCLNTKPDINAFAKLIAYKELKPPLAIGLFGKWGSGKSTFMDNLKRKIEELSKEKNTEEFFCEKIAHIKFNAWHYSDSNLWANLMIQIFEGLNKFLKPKEVDKIESPYLQLESTKEFLKEKEKEKIAIQDKIVQNKQKLENKINDKIKKTFKLNQLKDITKLVFEDEYIKSEFNQIREDFPFLKEKDINSVYKLYDDFNNNYGILKKFFSLLFKEKLFRKYLLGLLLVLILVFGLYFYIQDIKFVLSPLLILLPIGYKYINKFNKVTSNISKFIEFYERKKSENEKNELELNLLKEQANLESELIILEETISLENKRLEEISFEIEHIKSGKHLADFIMERANSSDYKQHLGLISLIRNDLEKLNDYLNPKPNPETGIIEETRKPIYKIDRIVLYIDDLDRCSEDKIMDVLEAIHLLLAFDLFVVIVGVDTRWIKNSLKSKRNLKGGKTATATEYLEKIFQIPFHLNNMVEDVKKEQLKKLMKNDLIVINEKINNKDENKLKETSANNSTNTENKNSSNNIDLSENNSHKELKIDPREYNYILKNANFLGETPRTIKRFVNIYRIIRSHDYVLNELLTEFEMQYKFIVMLLCLNDKFDKNSNKEDGLTIMNYIQKLKDLEFDVNDINDLEKFKEKDELFKFISRFSFRDCR